MRKTMISATLAIGLLAVTQAVFADVLLIEKVQQAETRDLPRNGLSMNDVERRFGRPLERRAAVGDPPITRWVYDDYSVFFEHDLVIQSVLHPDTVVTQTGRP